MFLGAVRPLVVPISPVEPEFGSMIELRLWRVCVWLFWSRFDWDFYVRRHFAAFQIGRARMVVTRRSFATIKT